MIVEILLSKKIDLEIKGYNKIPVVKGIIWTNLTDGRIEVVAKIHPDGRMSIFTDRAAIIKMLLKHKDNIIDLIPK